MAAMRRYFALVRNRIANFNTDSAAPAFDVNGDFTAILAGFDPVVDCILQYWLDYQTRDLDVQRNLITDVKTDVQSLPESQLLDIEIRSSNVEFFI